MEPPPAGAVPWGAASRRLLCFVGCQKEIRQGDREVLRCPRKALELVFQEEGIPAAGGERNPWFSMSASGC